MADLFVRIDTVPDFTVDEYRRNRARILNGNLSPKSEDAPLYWKMMRGSLRHSEGKIILIEYQIGNGPLRQLKEWERGEKSMLESFYRTLQDMRRGGASDPLRIVGYNIQGFDMPFIYARMREHRIDDSSKLQYYTGAPAVDMMQIHLPLNGMSIWGLRRDTVAEAYGIPPRGGPEDVANSYYNGRYDEILGCNFAYPEMFAKMQEGLVSSARLGEAVKNNSET